MSSGQWSDFTTGSLTNATLYANTTSGNFGILNSFGSKLVWDPAHKKMNFAASSHTGGAIISGSGGLAVWDDATNTWSRETYDWSSEDPGHEYYHVTVNPTSGDLYFRSFNSRTVLRRQYGSTGQASWQSFSTIGHGNYANQVAGGLEWFPERNSGSGGLVFADTLGCAMSDAALTTWTGQTGSSSSGAYHNWIQYANGRVYFGGGNGSSAMFSIGSTGTTPSSHSATPLSAGPNLDGIVLGHPNGTDLLLFENFAASGAIHRFNGTSWSSAGTHSIGDSSGCWAGGAVPEYGVMLFLMFPNTSGTPFCKVYKP